MDGEARWWERLIGFSCERAGGASRTLALMIYPLLVVLAGMQILSAGTIERIAQQDAGRALFAALAGFLLLAALFAISSVASQNWQYGGALSGPAAADALLHFSTALVCLEFSVGDLLLTGRARALIIGGFGLLLLGSGAYLSLFRPRAAATGRKSLVRRDRIARGGIFCLLGTLLFLAAMSNGGFAARELTEAPWGLPILLAIPATLLGYVLHTLRLIREESNAWAH